MVSPRTVLIAARSLLAIGSAFVAAILLGPFLGAERLLGLEDKQAHAIAFFVFTALSMVAAPKVRRLEMALAAISLAAASEIAQAVVGRDASLGDVLADAAGVLLAVAPTYVTDFRLAARGVARPRRRSGDVRSADVSGTAQPARTGR
jgi:hypothetical protein